MSKKHLISISLIYLATCAFYYLRMISMTYPGFPLDDSWIHQVFARNLVNGYGFSFNPGQPIAGATAPLWTLLLALTWPLMGPIAGGMIPGLILQWLAYLAIYKIAQKITGNNKLALLNTVVSILLWPTIWGALSGMETGLFSALSLWGLYFYFRSDRLSDKYSYIAYALFTLAFLARPECALFIAAAGIRDFYQWVKSDKREFLPWIYRFLIVFLITAPYFIFNLLSTGTPLPSTFAAKIRGHDLISAILNGDIKRILHAITVNPYFYLQHFYRKTLSINPIIVLASMAGVFKLISSSNGLKSKNVMLGMLFLLYVPLMGVFSPIFSAAYQQFRYATNLFPILALLGILGFFWNREIDMKRYFKIIVIVSAILIVAGLGLKYIFKYFSDQIIPLIIESEPRLDMDRWERLYGVVTRVGYGTALMGLILFTGYILNTKSVSAFVNKHYLRPILIALTIVTGAYVTIRNADTYANNVRNINEADVDAAIFLGEIAEEGDVVAVNDIGSFGYFANMEIFDLWGLVNRELDYNILESDSLIFEYMYDNRRVDYMAVFPSWFGYLSSRTDVFKPLKTFASENNTILAEDSTVVYRAVWPDSLARSPAVLPDAPIDIKASDSDL
ncbi:MAG: glycosyltransferase family 39 protein [Candidatus Zixiibacteriota bacterium]|nr:MAG: glycosyltransferase family 39 protein [candidate division Zixibacteria bacterium]